MLNIWYGEPGDRVLTNPDRWFKNGGKRFLNTEFSKNLIRSIDSCRYISNDVVDSKYLGVVVSDKISSGSKAIMCMLYEENKLVKLAYLGENMYPYLAYVSNIKDVFIIATMPCEIYSKSDYTGKVRILNTGRVVCNLEDLTDVFFELCNEENRVEDVLERSVLDEWRKRILAKIF